MANVHANSRKILFQCHQIHLYAFSVVECFLFSLKSNAMYLPSPKFSIYLCRLISFTPFGMPIFHMHLPNLSLN